MGSMDLQALWSGEACSRTSGALMLTIAEVPACLEAMLDRLDHVAVSVLSLRISFSLLSGAVRVVGMGVPVNGVLLSLS